MSSVLQIFVKNPVAGQTKTRLAAGIGHDLALEAYRRLLFRMRNLSKELASTIRIEVWYGNDIPSADLWAETGWPRLEQQGQDLGARMQNALELAFRQGARKVVLVGSDLPHLELKHLTDAFAALDTTPAVVGPATDGGYYLIGLTQMVPRLFDNIAWSTGEVLSSTRARLQDAGFAWQELPALNDLDTIEDLPGTFLEDLLEKS